MKKKLALVIPHSQSLRLLTDVLPINKLIIKYDLYIICENKLITERIENFCKKEKIILLGFNFKDINNHNFIKRFLRNVRAFFSLLKIKIKLCKTFGKHLNIKKRIERIFLENYPFI